MDHSPSLRVPADVKLLVRRGPSAQTLDGPVVIVRAGGYEYFNQVVDAAALIDKLSEARKRNDDWQARGWHRGDPAQIYIVVDGDARWKDVVAVTDAAQAHGFIHASFAFAKSATKPPRPPPATVDAQLDAIAKLPEGGNKAVELANLMSHTLEPCPPATTVFGDVASREGGDAAGDLIRGLGPALIECDCKTSPAELRNVVWSIAANPTPTSLIDVTLDETVPIFARSAQALWRDVGKDLAPGKTKLVAQ